MRVLPRRKRKCNYLETAVEAGAVDLVGAFLATFFAFADFFTVEVDVVSLVAGAVVDGVVTWAKEIPASARERERPQTAEAMFFMLVSDSFLRGAVFLPPLLTKTPRTINRA